MSVDSNAVNVAGTVPVNLPGTVPNTARLLAGLEAQRHRVVGIVAELDDDAMTRPVLPSGWSCAGMVRHLTSMTTFWFEAIMSGREAEEEADDFVLVEGEEVGELVDRYIAAVRRGHDLVRDLSLDSPPAWWPDDLFGPWRLHTLFDVLQHVLVETATHAGHLDAARELIDGRTWCYPLGRLTEPTSPAAALP